MYELTLLLTVRQFFGGENQSLLLLRVILRGRSHGLHDSLLLNPSGISNSGRNFPFSIGGHPIVKLEGD